MLSHRLRKISDLIQPSQTMCDVGSDHALLPIALLKSSKVEKAIVVEIAKGPLEKAQFECANQGVSSKVDFYLSDGLLKVNQEIDVVVCAGMGFDTISGILLNSLEKFKKIDQIILQSNSKVDELRQFMNQYKFVLIDEAFVLDRKRPYVILKYSYNTKTQVLNDEDYIIGPILKHSNQSDYLDYLKNQLILYTDLVKNDPHRYQSKVDHLRKYLASKETV